ncbi:heavy-metal-associated domain-containing protein [Nonlabens xiamenensis]|uniref:heavy-metal-associated domain-containing protein n=1 Tax=Nonlabens xiamenensis TaxID=2341043 RepID=UPI000F612967|nr:heavy metal-associated domain-containing protein [Nonlabens xiamenensis]
MTHIYQIKGMTCNGCRSGVENILNALPAVTKASVDLEKEEAVLKMTEHIPLDLLQKALPEKYSITEKEQQSEVKNVFTSSNEITDEPISKLKALRPLFLILGYISVASALMHRENWDVGEFMLDFMGLFFIVFAFFKLLDLKGFPASFKMYDPLAKLLPIYGWIYPFLETALGLMFLMRFEVQIALIITLLILSITTAGVAYTLFKKRAIKCACLGTALQLPMTEATLIENMIMLGMAVFMLWSA